MPGHDSFNTIEGPANGSYREAGSKFVAVIFPVSSGNEAEEAYKTVKKEHPRARHHCFAMRLAGHEGRVRTHDGREPKGSAGPPILNAIQKHGLSNVMLVVSRYFGGKQVGLPRLMRAYHQAALDAIGMAKPVTRRYYVSFEIEVPYPDVNELMTLARRYNGTVAGTGSEPTARYRISVRKNDAVQFAGDLQSHSVLHRCPVTGPSEPFAG